MGCFGQTNWIKINWLVDLDYWHFLWFLEGYFPGFGLAVELGVQMLQRRNEPVRYFQRRGNVHRGRKHVVRRLAHIDVVVGMDRRFGAARAAEDLVGAIGDHLVDVHVGLGARPGLPHDQRKMIVEGAVDDFLGGLHDRAHAARVQQAEFVVHLGRRPFDDRKRADHRQRDALGADAEVLERALRLCAPVAIGRNLDRSEAVGFAARLRHGGLPRLCLDHG